MIKILSDGIGDLGTKKTELCDKFKLIMTYKRFDPPDLKPRVTKFIF